MLRRIITALACWLALSAGSWAVAATRLETSEVLAVNAEAAAQLPQAREFTLAADGNFTVTLRDLGVPVALRGSTDLEVAPLQSLQALITRGLDTVAQLEIEYPTQPDQLQTPATVNFAGTPGSYRVHVIGALASGEASGFYRLDVAPTSGGPAVFQVADGIATLSGPAPGQSVLTTEFTTAVAGTYRVQALDRSFPSALVTRDVLVLRTLPTVAVMVDSRGQPFSPADAGTFTAAAGDTYQLVVIANAGTDMAGLYGAIVRGGSSDTVIYSSENPVGQLPPSREINIAAAGAHTLTLADLEFPEALQSFSAAIIQNGTFAGSAVGATPANLTLSTGSARLFVFATLATTGALSATVAQGAQVDYADVHIVDASPDATTPAIYSFRPSQPVTAGDYTLTIEDLRFPSALPSIDAAVIQGTTVVHEFDGAGSEPVTLQAGAVRVLVAATPPAPSAATPGNGVFTLALTTRSAGTVALESTQGVGGLFNARVLNVPAAGRYDIALKDFEFPERLRTSWLAVTRGTTLVGQVIGSSSIQNLRLEAGPHVLNFLGQPAANTSYGTFGMKVSDSAPPPVVTLTARPATITSGQTTSLEWTVTNATSCSASGGWTGTRSASGGTQPSNPLTANTTFDIECLGPGGRGNASVTVTVNPAAPRSEGGGGPMEPLLLAGLFALLAAARRHRTFAGVRGLLYPDR